MNREHYFTRGTDFSKHFFKDPLNAFIDPCASLNVHNLRICTNPSPINNVRSLSRLQDGFTRSFEVVPSKAKKSPTISLCPDVMSLMVSLGLDVLVSLLRYRHRVDTESYVTEMQLFPGLSVDTVLDPSGEPVMGTPSRGIISKPDVCLNVNLHED